MKKLFFLLFLSIFLISLVSAGSAGEMLSDVAKINKCYILPQVCSSCSYVQVSAIVSPNGTLNLIDDAMNKNGTYYYYNFCNVNETGVYQVNGNYDVVGVDRPYNYYFESTNTGTVPTTAQGGLSIGLILVVILMVFFFGILSFKFMENDTTFPIGLFFLVMSIIFSVYSMFLGFMLSRDFLLTNISGVQEKVFLGVLISLTGIVFIALTLFIMKVIKELKVKKDSKNYGEGYDTSTGKYNY